MVRMDFEYNIKDLLPNLEEYLEKLETTTPKVVKAPRVTKKTLESYDSIINFIYAKMTTGGMVNQGVELSDQDLKVLKKLIIKEEQERRKLRKK